jgi:hypothetical protein
LFRLASIFALVLGISFLVVRPVGNAPPAQAAAEDAEYRITITNISAAQPLSAPLLVTHLPNYSILVPGTIASDGLRKLAEEGVNDDLATALRGHSEVHEVVQGEQPVRRRGGGGPDAASSSYTFTIHAGPGDVLSIAAMLGCTNDAFTGVINMQLPDVDAIVVRPFIFDAGTEANTEKSVDIPDSCADLGAQALSDEDGNGRVPTSEPIALHPGLHLRGDLTSASAWSGPVVQIAVERVGPGGQTVGQAIPSLSPYDEVETPGNAGTSTSVPDETPGDDATGP